MKDHSSQEDPPWPTEFVVRQRDAVPTLLDLKALRILGPFLRGPRTLSSAAVDLGLGTSTLAYWIRKLERTGLLVRLPSQRRAGMAMPRYRAAGRSLFLPFTAVPPGMTSELLDGGRQRLLARFLDGLDDEVRRVGHAGLQVRPSGDTGVELDFREPDAAVAPPTWTDFWGTLRLSREHATEFASELKAVVERFRGLEHPRNAKQFIVHAGIAPASRHVYRSV